MKTTKGSAENQNQPRDNCYTVFNIQNWCRIVSSKRSNWTKQQKDKLAAMLNEGMSLEQICEFAGKNFQKQKQQVRDYFYKRKIKLSQAFVSITEKTRYVDDKGLHEAFDGLKVQGTQSDQIAALLRRYHEVQGVQTVVKGWLVKICWQCGAWYFGFFVRGVFHANETPAISVHEIERQQNGQHCNVVKQLVAQLEDVIKEMERMCAPGASAE